MRAMSDNPPPAYLQPAGLIDFPDILAEPRRARFPALLARSTRFFGNNEQRYCHLNSCTAAHLALACPGLQFRRAHRRTSRTSARVTPDLPRWRRVGGIQLVLLYKRPSWRGLAHIYFYSTRSWGTTLPIRPDYPPTPNSRAPVRTVLNTVLLVPNPPPLTSDAHTR